jgi:hypothetical protein
MNLGECRNRTAHSHNEIVRECWRGVFVRSFGLWMQLVALASRSPLFSSRVLRLANFASTFLDFCDSQGYHEAALD